ncbi:ATP-binding protein [Streptomyces sp. NA04227]|uniref:ATP-binding protein n=1 Tax=Streptomyces sp. NA04227 TaxID=2742136 RepID=UPI001591544A|nr:ATP-binding protein [Streptomyces sp. NA04227]QKW11040.1 ATP-binding protein [Streptomyces sp. NA04227]
MQTERTEHPECVASCQQFSRRERRSVAAARKFARRALTEWGLERLLDDVVLCVSELSTNALVHGVPPDRGFLLRLYLYDGGTLRVEVHDSGDGHPHIPAETAGSDEEKGRGLFLVRELADAWGVGERNPGKVVWCEWRA